MYIRKDKLVIFFVGLCLAIGVAVSYSIFTKNKGENNLAISQKSTAESYAKPLAKEAAPKNPQETIKPDISKPLTINGQSYIALTNEEVSTLRAWMDDRGYGAESDWQVYEGYSKETLLQLAKNGDLKALDILSSMATDKGDRKKAVFYINLGILHGSTAALERLTIYTAPNSTNDATEEQRRPSALETLAVTQVLAMRGDRHLARSDHENFIKSYKRLYNVDLILTPTEETFVSNRAQEIYDAYQSVRREMGLGDFDNSEPSGVKKFFGFQ